MRYGVTFLMVVLLTTGFIGGANWLIDPYGRYWSPTITGFNQAKPSSGSRVRVTKAYRSVEVAPEVLFVGNSRVEMGLDPQYQRFASVKVYNLGMPGADVEMQVDYALNVIHATKTVRKIIMGVDFLDFLDRETFFQKPRVEDKERFYRMRLLYLDPPNPRKYRYVVKEQASLIFSLDSFFASLMTLSRQAGNSSTINEYGLNTAQDYVGIIRREGLDALFVQKITELGENLSRAPLSLTSSDGAMQSPAFGHLQRLIDVAGELDIDVTLFVSPYHFSYLHLLADVGLIGEFWRWKSLLVDQLDHSDVHPATLWDFSIFSQPVMESVPLDRPNTEMEWYWEPAHYRRELGDRMLDVMLGSARSELAYKLDRSTLKGVVDRGKRDLDLSRIQWLELKRSLGLESKI